MVSLAQKLKLLKTCEKRLYKHITMGLRKNPLEKRAKNQKISRFKKLAKMTNLQRLETLQNGQFGSKINISRNMPKTSVQAH